MRDFGFGRRYEEYELEVKDEMEKMIQVFKDGPKFDYETEYLRSKGVVNLPKALINTMANCYLQVIASERLPRGCQEKMFNAGKASFKFQLNSDEFGKSISIFPWLATLLPGLSRYRNLREGSVTMYEFMAEFLDKQIQTYQEGHIRSFMDTYIKEMKAEDGEKRGYLREQFLMIITDFLFPSLSAMESQVGFLLRHLMNRPDIMKRVQEEIDEVVGHGRLPSLDDRVHLPFTEATLRESMR